MHYPTPPRRAQAYRVRPGGQRTRTARGTARSASVLSAVRAVLPFRQPARPRPTA